MECNNRYMMVLKELKCLFKKIFIIDLDIYDRSILESPLLCKEIGMSPGDLLLLFYDIEKSFKIHFSEEDILTGFRCLHDITSVIVKKTQTL